MVSFKEYVRQNKVDLVRGSTVLEGYVLSHLITQKLLQGEVVPTVGYRQTKEVLNLDNAWSWVQSYSGSLHENILEDLHEIISDGVTTNPDLEGYFRPETREVVISESSYVPPCKSRRNSLSEFKYKLLELVSILEDVGNTIDYKLVSLLSFYAYLMKRQFFHDCNKRTAYLFTNYLLRRYNLGYILLLPSLKSEGTFLDYLKAYYEDTSRVEEGKFIYYLQRYYLKKL